MASIKSGSLLASGADGEAEMLKLRSEVERLEVSTQETLLAQQAKHNLEISGLKEQLEEADRRLRTSDLDMASLREKLDQARLDSLQVRITIVFPWNHFHENFREIKLLLLISFLFLQESEETMAELKNVYEREKVMLLEENKKCQFELERMAEINNRLQLEKRQFEEDYHEMRNKKEAVAQWEAQISEIINW